MTTEESPLLGDQLPSAQPDYGAHPTKDYDVYDRFNRKQKRVILVIVALAGLLPSVSCIPTRFSHVYKNCRSLNSVCRWLLYPIDTPNLQGPQRNTRRCEVCLSMYNIILTS